MGKYYLGTGNQQINFQVVDSTGVINDLNLSGLYLSITGKAADADKLDNFDSSFFRNAQNLTGIYTGQISGSISNADTLDGLDSSYFLNGANITGTVSLSGTFTGYYTGAFSGTITHTDSITFHTGLGINPDPAELTWSDDVGTMQLGLQGGNIDLRVGLQNYEYVTNRNASTLSKGSVVYISGAQGNRPAVALALANADSTSAVTFGILAEDIASMANGYAITNGLLTNLNTTGFAEGAALYLSPTVSGAVISSKPQAPSHSVLVGFCVRSHASAGEILVKIQNGVELDELHDVRITSAQNNDIIRYNAPSGVWFNSNTLALNGTGSHYISGDLGIGTSSPSAKLHIFGADKRQIITSTTDNAALVLGQWDGTTNRIESSTRKLLLTSYANGISLGVNGSENVHVSTSGYLGVGTTSPSELLDIAASTDNAAVAGPKINFKKGSTNKAVIGIGGNYLGQATNTDDLIFRNDAGNILFGFNGAERMRINSSGQLMINTSAVSTFSRLNLGNAGIDLQVDATTTASTKMNANATNNVFAIRAPFSYNPSAAGNAGAKWGIWFSGGPSYDTVNYPYTSTEAATTSIGKSAAIYAVSEDSGAGYNRQIGLAFYTSNFDANMGERVRIDRAGNVGIGTASPSQKLEVTGNIKLTNGGYIYGDGANAQLHLSNAMGSQLIYGSVAVRALAASVKIVATSEEISLQNNGGTIWMTAGGNVGIGTTSPTEKFYVNGGNAAIEYVTGSVTYTPSALNTSPRLTLIGQYSTTDTYNFIRYWSGGSHDWSAGTVTRSSGVADYIFQSYNGSAYGERLRITAAGNVGIGVTAPDVKLEVSGDVSIRSANYLYFGQYTNSVGSWATRMYALGGYHYFNANGFIFSNEGYSATEWMRITTAGNVGIGTTSPNEKLEVGGNISVRTYSGTYGSLRFGTTNASYLDAWAGIESDWESTGVNVANLKFYTSYGSRSEKMRITSAGNIGIGTTSPVANLHIYRGVNSTVATLGEVASYSTVKIGRFRADQDNSLYIGNAGSFCSFLQGANDAGSNAMHILINPFGGNVGIGTTSPTSKLYVSGDITANIDNSLGVKLNRSATNVWNGIGYSTANSTKWFVGLRENGDDNLRWYNYTNTSEKMVLTEAGSLGIGTTTPTYKLHVVGDARIGTNAQRVYLFDDGNAHIHSGSGPLWLNAEDSSGIYINNQTNGSVYLTNGTGRVGIGTTSVSYNLEVAKASAGATFAVNADMSAAGEASIIAFTSKQYNTYYKAAIIAYDPHGGSWNRRGLAFCVNNTTDGTSASYASDKALYIAPDKSSTFYGSVTIGGDLIINGTTTTVNSTVTTIDDPIITLGGDTTPTVDDNKDRGVEFKWHNGTAAKVGFFGFDDSTGYFTFIPDATNSSEVFSGTQGDIQAANFRGTLIGSLSNALTAGSYLTGSPTSSYNGSAAVTFAVDATSANTASKVVARDGNGDFSARIITATTFSGALSGNSSTTTKLNVTDSRNAADTPETISMGVVADFKANATNSLSDGGTYNGVLTFRQYGSGTDWSGGRSHQLAFTDNDNIWHRSGTSTSWGTWYKIWHQNNDGAGSGLDADLLDGYNQDTANTANTIVRRDASGNFSAGVITGTRLEARNSGTTQIYIDSTNNGSKEIVFQNNGATTGYLWQASTYLGLGGGSGSNSLFVTTSNGNVGVGTTSPSNKLDVNGSVRTNDWYYVESSGFGMYNNANAMWWASHASGSYSLSSNTTFSGIKLYSGGSVNTWRGHFYGDSSGQGFLNSSGNWQFIVNSSGNVGIGTTSPAAKLEVNGDFKNGLVYRYPHSQIAPALNSTGWIKLATIPNNSRAKFLMRNGSANSEEILEFDVYTTYFNSGVYVVISRNTYNHHLTEIQVQGADGQPRIVYVKCRTSDYAPTFIWQVESWNGASTIHNTEETPTSGKNFVIGTTGYLNANYVPNVYFDGNVGIGQIPATKLNVKEQNSGTEGFIVTNWNGVNTVLAGSDSSSGGGKFTLKTNAGANAVFISSTASSYFNGGKVGINTTSPDSFLQIKTTTAQTTIDDANQILTIENAAATDASGNLGGIRFRQINATNAANGFIGLSSTGSSSTRANLVFASPNTSGNATEKMRLTAYGTLLVGDNIDFNGGAWWNNGNAVLGKNGTDKVVIGYLGSSTLGAMIGAHNSAMTAWAGMNINGTSISFRIAEATKAVLDANGAFVQGGGTGRSTYGTTVVLNRATTFAANSDVGDGERFLSIVNDNSTTNAMATLGFRINPNGGNANAMLDMKFVNTGATSTSKLHYSFNHGGSWADRLTIQSDGNVGIGTASPGYKLDVSGDARVTGSIRISTANTTGNGIIFADDGDIVDLNDAYCSMRISYGLRIYSQGGGGTTQFQFATSQSGAPTYLNAGNVGIGLTTPSEKLHIAGTVRIDGTTNGLRIFKDGGAAVTSTLYLANSGNTRAYNWQLNSSGDGLDFFTYDGNAWAYKITYLANGNVGIGTQAPSYKLEVNGSFAATTKSFVIPHPTKEGKKLRYGSLEGPENGVYIRGKTTSKVIELPDYWTKLVDPDSITVQLTPIGSHQKLYVEKIEYNKVYIANENLLAKNINCFFYILAERADVEKLQVEIDA